MHFNEALFWTALTAFGTGLYFIMEASRKWIAWGVMILGAGGMVYSVYRNYHTDSLGLPIWFYLLAVTWILLGSDVYDRNWGRQSKSAKNSAEWRQGFSRPRFEIIGDHRFENEEIVVDNKSFRRCSFKNVKLLFHGQAPFEFVEGTTIDPGTVFFNTDDPAVMVFNFMQTQFASLPGARVQPGALDSTGKDIPFPPVTVEPMSARPKPSQYPIPSLRLKVLEMVSELHGFLGAHGQEPEIERELPEASGEFMRRWRSVVDPWRAKFRGDYRIQFGESVPRLRDEILSRAAIDDWELNAAIEKAANDPNHTVQSVAQLAKRLYDLGYLINA